MIEKDARLEVVGVDARKEARSVPDDALAESGDAC
jgi:hypothetical protein